MIEPVKMTTNNYGMPALSAEAKAEIDKASAKLPRKYKTSPLFDITDPSQMIPWFEATESIFEHGGITSDEAKVRLALEWTSYKMRQALRVFDLVKKPNWDQFKKDLKNMFPQSVGDERGSRLLLEQLVHQFNLIDAGEQEKMRIFRLLFDAEMKKLMDEPKMITNSDAVRLFLAPMTPKVRRGVLETVVKDVSVTSMSDRRKEDPFKIDEVMNAAEKYMIGSSFDNYYQTLSIASSSPPINNPNSFSRGHINLPFAADVPKTDRNYLQALKPKVEDEFKDLLGIKLESLIPRELTEEQQQMVALNKDLMEANMKEIRAVKSLQSHFKEGADIMTQLTAVMAQMAKENAKGMINSIPPSGPSNQSNRFERNTTPRSSNGTQWACFLCKSTDHFMNECPHLLEFTKRGWMMPEGGDSKCYKLRDNARMPRDDPNIPRYKKIEQMAKDLGWDRAESYFANMEDDEDDKVMDQQMNPNVNLAVWMTRIEELSDRLGNLEAHREDDVRVFNQDSSNGKK
ncbi:hypothetical protein HHX47_DHR3000776 [Lentinula edodes]|nr:hypothetical protein HHX47_DHR3000776 [Lentinula edodes]